MLVLVGEALCNGHTWQRHFICLLCITGSMVSASRQWNLAELLEAVILAIPFLISLIIYCTCKFLPLQNRVRARSEPGSQKSR